MTGYVALLGGVNVGGRTLKMDALRATAAELGKAAGSAVTRSTKPSNTARSGFISVTAVFYSPCS